MEQPFFKVKKLKEKAVIPSKREEDAGYDLYGVFEESFKVLKPGESFLAPTGIAVEIPKNWVFYVVERSSSGSKGLAKRAGVVDSGYRGEVFVALNNTSDKTIIFAHKEGPDLADFLEEQGFQGEEVTVYPQSKAIAQALILYVPHIEVEVVEELDSNSQRKDGTLGSSNK